MSSLHILVFAAVIAVAYSGPVNKQCAKIDLKSTTSVQSTTCSSGQLYWGKVKGTVKLRFRGIKEPLCLKQGDNAGPKDIAIIQKMGKKNEAVTFDSDGQTCLKVKGKAIVLYIKSKSKNTDHVTLDFAIQSEASFLGQSQDLTDPQPIKTKDSQKTKIQAPPAKNNKMNTNKSYPTLEERLGFNLNQKLESAFTSFGKFVWGVLSKMFH